MVPRWSGPGGEGMVVPVPVLCSVTFGAPVKLEPGEDRRAFLERAR